MSKIMVIAKLKLNNENLLEDWKTISKKIDDDLSFSRCRDVSIKCQYKK